MKTMYRLEREEDFEDIVFLFDTLKEFEAWLAEKMNSKGAAPLPLDRVPDPDQND